MKSLTREHAEKLMQKGLLKKDTYDRMAQRFNEGGVAESVQKGMASMLLPKAQQMPIEQAETPAPLMRQTAAPMQDQFAEPPQNPMVNVVPASNQPTGEVVMTPQGQTSGKIKIPGEYVDLGAERMIKDNLAQQNTISRDITSTLKGVSDGMRDFAEQEAQRQKLESDLMNQQQQAMSQAEMDYSKSAIDPSRLYKNMSTGQKITAVLSVALGGTDALNVLNTAVDRDIMAQKAEVDRLGSKAKAQRNLYQDMMDRFKNDSMARAATKNIMYQAAELQLKGMMEQTRNLNAQQNGLETLAKIQAERAKAQAEFAQATKLSPMIRGEIEFGNEVLSLPKEQRELAVRLPNNKVGFTTSAENAKIVTKTLPAMQNIKDLTKELIELSGPGVATERVGQAKSIAGQLLLAIKEAKQLGALDAGAITIAERMIGDPTTFNVKENAGKLKAFQTSTQKDEQNFLRQYIINYDNSSANIDFKERSRGN